jgi:hypothetical protein
MPLLIARDRKPATQRAKAGGCAAAACPQIAKLAATPSALLTIARRVMVWVLEAVQEIRGMAAF